MDTLRLRLGLDLPGGVKATYAAGYFGNQADSRAQTYLRDSAGNPLYSGSLNINGYAYTIAASAFSKRSLDRYRNSSIRSQPASHVAPASM